MTGGRFSSFDGIWRHPTSNATLYVGGQAAAESLELLNKYGITRVVNCTEELPNYHAKNRKGESAAKKTKKRSSSTDESKNARAYAASAPASPSQVRGANLEIGRT